MAQLANGFDSERTHYVHLFVNSAVFFSESNPLASCGILPSTFENSPPKGILTAVRADQIFTSMMPF
jgi:hypothetical protein